MFLLNYCHETESLGGVSLSQPSTQGTQLSNINIASISSLPPNINLQGLTGLQGVSLGLQHMQVNRFKKKRFCLEKQCLKIVSMCLLCLFFNQSQILDLSVFLVPNIVFLVPFYLFHWHIFFFCFTIFHRLGLWILLASQFEVITVFDTCDKASFRTCTERFKSNKILEK